MAFEDQERLPHGRHFAFGELLGKAPQVTKGACSWLGSSFVGIPSLRSRSVGPRRTDIHVLTALSPHPCGSAHCARPAFSLHPSRDWCRLGVMCMKIKIKCRSKASRLQPVPLGVHGAVRGTGFDRSHALRDNAAPDAPRPSDDAYSGHRGDAERHGMHSHAERGNDQRSPKQRAPRRTGFSREAVAVDLDLDVLRGSPDTPERDLGAGRTQTTRSGPSGMDAARAPPGHGCPFGACPRSVVGVRGPDEVGPNREQALLVTFSAF